MRSQALEVQKHLIYRAPLSNFSGRGNFPRAARV
jgi:hypothetical protein